MVILIKAFAIGLALIAISKSYLDYKKKLEPRAMFIFWTVVWIGATILVTYPVIIDQLNQYTRDQSLTIGSITSVAYVFMLYIVYRIYVKAARLERQLAKLIRRNALEPKQARVRK